MANFSFVTCKVEDEYGVYPSALVAIYDLTETSKSNKGSEIKEGAPFREVNNAIIELSFMGNYWQNADAQAAGKRSRPLMEDGSVTIKVDLTSKSVVESLNGAEEWDDNLIAACKSHVVASF